MYLHSGLQSGIKKRPTCLSLSTEHCGALSAGGNLCNSIYFNTHTPICQIAFGTYSEIDEAIGKYYNSVNYD